MMHCMTSGSIQDWRIGYIFTVMNEDGPDLDEEEETEISKFLEGEDEREEVVGERLHPAIDGVEGN